ncbi:hypothetical protein DMC30DRAFT_412305 [Rhodotorula diobovata]|uniref:Uncharacterized protein n=1 Tax=Rhodotorula diobovata TaxID=5288 RepID=A0A5C5FQR3_9BASI|nr:hypothetical protein DMC30DRAFT_412305 [Rhodotorula diobovata]
MNRSSPARDGDTLGGLPIYPRKNIFGNPLLPVPVGNGPQTGFFRNNYCDASPADPASHTVAAVVTPEFLDFSKSRGNDLWPLFPSMRAAQSSSSSSSASSPSLSTSASPAPGPSPATSSPEPCIWCLCATRWFEAFRAAASHPLGDRIVPRVVLEATHERAPADGKFERAVLERWAVGGDGSGRLPERGGKAKGGGGGGGGGEAIGR